MPDIHMRELLEGFYQLVKNKYTQVRYYDSTPLVVYNSDLYIVEFPKSGISWFTTIISNIYAIKRGSDVLPTFYNLEQFIGDVHHNKNIAVNYQYPYYRVIKSHAEFNPNYRKVIYIVRNPLSVMESYFNYLTKQGLYTRSIEEFCKDKQFGIDAWVKHVNSWIEPKKALGLHLVRYEDLIDSPENVIAVLCQNVGYNISMDDIKASVEASSFDNMKISNNLCKNNNPSIKYDFVRSGNVKSEIRGELKNFILDRSSDVIKKLYADFNFTDV